ncbi:MAG TPA: ribosome maturation factor RimM [Bryobacteraceae bacterium]|nr:ribosome maturation factor RimM [Bryobacteraceae bacterium]
MSPTNSDWVILAEIVRSRGNAGEVAVNDLTTGPDRFIELGTVSVLAPDDASQGDFEVEHAWAHNGATILKFKGINSISEADALRGLRVAIPASRRRTLPPGEFFFGDLVGCQVVDAKNQTAHGRVAAVHEQGGATGLLELEDGLLIPLAKNICVSIQPEAGRIEVVLPEGLVELFRNPS